MKYLCLDFEGVLIPEIWQYVAKETGSKELMLTTQDLKDYDELMQLRMKVVNEKNIKLSDIQEIVKSMIKLLGKNVNVELSDITSKSDINLENNI